MRANLVDALIIRLRQCVNSGIERILQCVGKVIELDLEENRSTRKFAKGRVILTGDCVAQCGRDNNNNNTGRTGDCVAQCGRDKFT